MNIIEGQFSAAYDPQLGDYVVSIPKIECVDPEDQQTKTFGETGGYFCGFRAPGGFNYPILPFDGDRLTIKPAAMADPIVSGTKPLFAHAMILDRGGPTWEDTKVCQDLFVMELTPQEVEAFLRKIPTHLLKSQRVVESALVLNPPASWGEDYTPSA